MQNQPQFLQQDGTSQDDRVQNALDPGYVSVDERSVKDLLVFARKYAKELRYFNEQNEAQGDWSGFLGDYNLDEIVAYLNNPQPNASFSRPHLVLFLTFLQLLQQARAQLNDLTRRHLEFYYREALQLTSRQGIPDQVHALISLVDSQNEFLLPAGTLLNAGQDSLGRDLFYRTDHDLFANRASVESLKSLYAQKMIIGIREARQTPDLVAELFPANKDLIAQGKLSERTFMAMLAMALGTPGPGSPLPLYPGNLSVNPTLLSDLDALLAFMSANLYMPFSTFRSLMGLKLEQSKTGDKWKKVNDIIEAAGKKRDAKFTLDRSQPDNFEKNLLAALGRASFGDMFNGLPEVDDIYGLYRRRERDDVIEFIQTSLYMSVPDFTAMMDIVEEINGRWRQVYEILRSAGRKKQRQITTHQLQPPQIRSYDADKFAALVSRTLGTITYPKISSMTLANFDDCNREIAKLENYFHVTAEEFVFIREINQKQETAHPWEWDQVYNILEDAHSEKEVSDRRNALRDKHKSSGGFPSMIRFALGDPNPNDDLPDSRDFRKLSAESDKNYIADKLFLDPANFTYIRTIDAKGTSASDEEWNNVYIILEKAQGRKRGIKETPAEIEKWDNLYAATDATSVQVRLNAEGESTTPRWHTFGEGYTGNTTRTVLGDAGFAIASPLLALAEGTRTITLTLAFRADRFDKATVEQALKAPAPFRVLLSSAKEMVEIKTISLKLLDASFNIPGAEKPYQHALQITLTLNEQSAPVAPLTIDPLIQTHWPVLQIMLADIPDQNSPDDGPFKRYRAFQSLSLEKVHLRVDVAGLTSLTLQNDESILDAKKPFEPFGAAPVVGSSFYLAHPELSSKRLDSLGLNIDWLAVPDNLSAYYVGYANYSDAATAPTSPIADNTAFQANLKLFDNRSFFTVGKVPLFNADATKTTGASKTNAISVNGSAITAVYANYQRDLQPTIAEQALNWDRYWLLELLSPDFQHQLYPRAAASCAAKTTRYIVSTPYTPKIKRLSVSYSSSFEIDLTKTDLTPLADRLYHIEPFGYRDLAGHNQKDGPSFLPQYTNESELFIGIRNLAAPQTLSLLFQLAEGSADPDLARQDIQWDYLDGNNWKSLEEGKMLSDSTNGLLNSGIIRFDLAPAEPSTRLPANLYWIRAAITRNCRSVADTVAIKAQAIVATFIDQNNAPDHLAQPLPAESITSLVEPLTAVRSVQQPYSSFGGKMPELATNFYIRVSERLRHKNRALTSWDYEHMVLEAFPSIFKVKCLPVGSSEDPGLADVVQVIVIPDIKGKLPFNPFEPKSPADVLFQIEKYLKKQSAPFTKFIVKNPTYLRLKVRIGVRLRSNSNTGYYLSLLNDELQRYLAPWAYDHSAEIVFGGRVNSSLIVNFVEERPYVDYVAGIKLFLLPDDLHPIPYDADGPSAILPPDAVLVSDRSHTIDPIAEEGYEEEFFSGINYMKIELDFQIATK